MHSSFEHKIKTPDLQFKWQYPLNGDDINYSNNEEQKISLKKIHFISDDDNLQTPVSEENKLNELTNLCDDDKKNVLTRSDITNNCTGTPSKHTICNDTSEAAILTKSLYAVNTTSEMSVPEVKKMPDYMNIPNLWNIRSNESNNVQGESSSHDQQSDNSDWEIIDM